MTKLFSSLALAAAIMATIAPVKAATRTVTLSVPGMTCSTCPITVKHAISKVAGVTKTKIIYDQREAIVTFDDSKTEVETLTKATANAGYPSSPKNTR
ncbi:mercury resistance system periplasmic binding protein MerP [Glaciimonas sp. CA11.2]|uniref:mercury resistance system periplasmic binding protein MerP n=1 Tax=unclassified Glaciimonas TaxID=2644401 RepID=UPI002AB54E6C|nr:MULTISPECIES: mercury resistance system periplasmic binding protein MerP [unclassified Glaciimonas]MDY7548338.1 mercury resistance system periplasmic binding protein MerP [Glaciimonas sp. CA11.2]MEB0010512.1 mercury resistance system periplasmic binding protein MerP [Glaciimonas sp. Cout2]MEB0083538.1 mercury resistance system periplasmic binding protein MerP [Glaciimonas sp. Gout2]MEB0164312.1 mercury resistance system periplasmic binding protein MerP [Glaciimonas sp. CA11.2]